MNILEDRNLELTKGQLSLWTGEKLHPNTALRNVIYTFEIEGNLDVSVFRRAFQSSIDQIEAMRTVFIETEDTVVQSILPKIEYEVEVLEVPADVKSDEIDTWLYQVSTSPLDISSCIFNTYLAKVNPKKIIWVLTVHHLVTDTISQKIIFDYTQKNYLHFTEGGEKNTAPSHSFKDYIDYEKEQVLNPKNEISNSFWSEKVNESEALSKFYGVSNTFEKNNSTRLSFSLGAERSFQLRELAKNPEIRSFTFDLTIFNIFSSLLLAYLFKVTGENNLTIGTTNQNRANRKFKETVGYFIQIFPLITEIRNTDSFIEIIKRVRNETNANLMHSKSGFITPEMNRSYNVIFNYINTVFNDFAGFRATTKWLHNGHIENSQFFQCHLTDFNGSGVYEVHFDLNNEIFTRAHQKYITQHFTKVIDAFIEDSKTKLEDVSLITDDEIKIIENWNNTTVPFDEDETLLQKFESKVKESPDSLAIVFGRQQNSYDELNNKANQVAHFLIQKGIKKNDVVAVSLDRCFDMMVFIYGILKAGAAYLPLDVNSPNERLKFIVEDASLQILFYNHNGFDPNQLGDVECLNINQIDNLVSSLDTSNPNLSIASDDLAYVIYTSGSTGEPKGVKCHHKGICNRLNWMRRDYSLTEEDIFIQKTPITFDVSVWELFLPLQLGAKLVVEIPEGHKDPNQLIKTIQENNISVIHFVPSMLGAFVEAKDVGYCSSLQHLFCSGEVLPKTLVERTYEKLSQIKVVNLYGPTEASVDVTSWNCEKAQTIDSIPIGYPVANTQTYVVDKKLNLVPLGASGELCLGGVQVALGYLNRKELTQEKFVDNVFVKSSNEKMYRTGDIVTYRKDGAIEYIGRVDNQIKIRGKRVELGEIERVIELRLNIPQVVVIEKKGNLIAFHNGPLDVNRELKSKLLGYLPEFMIPNNFIKLKTIPITANGKVNRKELEKMDLAPLQEDENFIPPNGEIEEILASIWKEVLDLERVGARADFISLGGHSLAAIKITARINEEIEMKFPLNKIFELPTITQYAKYIEETLITLMDQEE